jgi:hypothetical protein
MKKSVVLSVLCWVFISRAWGQSTLLNPGESYTFSFNSALLPPPVSSPFADAIWGGYDLVANGGGNSSCHWRVEMFENNTTEAPISVIEQERTEDCSLQPTVGGAWQDLQGMVRVTAISSTLVSPMEVEITVPSPNGFLYYDGYIQPVPEPSTIILIAIGGIGGVLCIGRRHARLRRS